MFSRRNKEGVKKKKRPDWDDGRTIANMNVDGMPWYDPREDTPDLEAEDAPVIGENGEELNPDHLPFREPEQLSGKDLRRVILSATLIGVGIALVFILTAFILIQLMLIFWK